MSYQVTTPVFEGPLDLLLRLITERQLEITELSLVGLVDEYLAHLARIRTLDLEVTSEFLLIAATLIQMKARRLLPGAAPVDPDEELALAEERDRLLSRLLACLTFKDVAAVLAHRMEATARLVGRYAGLDPEVTPPPPAVRLPWGPSGLAQLAARLLARPREPDLDHLDLDLPSVAAAIEAVRDRVAAEIQTDFERLTGALHRPVEVVAYFLAVLELVRWGLIEATQEHPGTPIVLRHRRDAALGLVSEWQR
ncbi:MAG: segregation/condensation protein A [Acidimicrobiia bacterium]|nr:segregation/condensation protein A [Acidimicrobiia bacterium]